jgi:hypothetical protein
MVKYSKVATIPMALHMLLGAYLLCTMAFTIANSVSSIAPAKEAESNSVFFSQTER